MSNTRNENPHQNPSHHFTESKFSDVARESPRYGQHSQNQHSQNGASYAGRGRSRDSVEREIEDRGKTLQHKITKMYEGNNQTYEIMKDVNN